MKKLNILLSCGAGMSSGFLASSARKVAKSMNEDITVNARSKSEITDYLQEIDILLLGPHYSGELENFKKLASPYDVIVEVIPKDIYAMLDGKKLIDFAIELSNK